MPMDKIYIGIRDNQRGHDTWDYKKKIEWNERGTTHSEYQNPEPLCMMHCVYNVNVQYMSLPAGYFFT